MNIKKGFLQAVGVGSLALMTAFAPSAMAGKDFFKKDLRNETTEVVQIVGQRVSNNEEKGFPLTFVVHGGEKELQMVAYRVAQRLDDEGIPVAFLLAPDSDGTLISMNVAFYTKGGTQYNMDAYSHNDPVKAEEMMYEHAKKAYYAEFPVPSSF